MKRRLLFLLLLCAMVARADSLRLHDGTELVGRYLGGTQTQIWFERQGSLVTTPDVIPTALVEALKFGPTTATPAASPSSTPIPRPSLANVARAMLASGGLRYFSTVLATAWFPYASSTRKETLASPAGRLTGTR
jgi:hypothetical protein